MQFSSGRRAILRFLFLKHPHRSPLWALMQLETQARCLVTGPLRASLPGYSVIDGTQVLYQNKTATHSKQAPLLTLGNFSPQQSRQADSGSEKS